MTLTPNLPASAPISVTTDSVGWCVHLTGLVNTHYDFVAGTTNQDGAASSFELVLDDTTGANLTTGGDVSVGQTSPVTHASLEYTITAGTVQDVVLRTRALAGSASTTLTVTVLDPLD